MQLERTSDIVSLAEGLFRGPEGPAGRDGRDGRDGVPGPPGPAGGCGGCERQSCPCPQPLCTAVPLGMESGAIPDGHITASTTHPHCATSEARLHSREESYTDQGGWAGAWCANGPLNTNQWLQVFPGNYDQDTEVRHLLDPPVTARYVRFWPQTWNSHLSMRVEVLGHNYTVLEKFGLMFANKELMNTNEATSFVLRVYQAFKVRNKADSSTHIDSFIATFLYSCSLT
uniref:F5/8 type C domain-containing protein n=1 Tax=Branchiostoma floridae TaxID=7739 RepID=C3ZMM6_BRAFL|eukprot:XP_002590225.1 hypothetical protein BRAFLDRAFT_97412 [Branchiostoma floridae]